MIFIPNLYFLSRVFRIFELFGINYYWCPVKDKNQKNRLKKEGNETVTNCNAFKLRAADGKMRLTDIADTEQLFYKRSFTLK